MWWHPILELTATVPNPQISADNVITTGGQILIAIVTTFGGLAFAAWVKSRSDRKKDRADRERLSRQQDIIIESLGKVQHQVVNDHPIEPNMRSQSDDRHDEVAGALERLGQGQAALLTASQRQDRRFDGVDQRLTGIDSAISSVREDVQATTRTIASFVPSDEVDRRIARAIEDTLTPDLLRTVKARARRNKETP